MKNTIELLGKYAEAKMFIKTVDEVTIGQVITMLNEPVTEGGIVRIMPDAHYGKGSTVGTTIHYDKAINKVVPSIVGVDIGCLDAETEVLTIYGWVPWKYVTDNWDKLSENKEEAQIFQDNALYKVQDYYFFSRLDYEIV